MTTIDVPTFGQTGGVPGARNTITLGQFEKLRPMRADREAAARAYLFDPKQPSGYACDKLHGIEVEYTANAVKRMVQRVKQAQELVNA